MLESYAIALKATGKKPVDGLEEWFYRRYEPYLRYYTHQTGYHKDPKWKKFKGKKIVTFIRKFEKFYPAENYHQDYYQENFINYLMYKKACRREEQLKSIWQ